jgi:hypothetical protein
MENLIEFHKVLLNIENHLWSDSLFLPSNKQWSLESLCYVYDLDDLEDDEEVPKFALENKLIYVISISELQDIVSNALQQNPLCSENELFEAFLYYYKNDAFISIKK